MNLASTLSAHPDFVAIETNDRRVLAAIQPIDNITAEPIRHSLQLIPVDPLNPSTPVQRRSLDTRRNRRGQYVVFNAPGLEAYRSAFLPFPPAPEPGNEPVAIASIAIPLIINDPTGFYLPRRYTLRLPRDPNPEIADSDQSLFRPVPVVMFRAPGASVEPNWSVIRATVVVEDGDTGFRLPWSQIQLVQPDVPQPWISMADWRGEALIAIPGVPVVMSNGTDDGPTSDDDDGTDPDTDDMNVVAEDMAGVEPAVVVREVEVQLRVFSPPSLTLIAQDVDLQAINNPNPDYVPDPDDPGVASISFAYSLMAGRDRPETLTVTFSTPPTPP